MCHVARAEPATSGGRLFEIRAALGNGPRDPMPMRALAELVEKTTGEWYDPAAISLLERNLQRWRLDDVRNFAAVDPLGRGELWLSALEGERSGQELPNPAMYRVLTPQQVARAERKAEREQRESAERARNAGGRGHRRRR